MLSESFKPCFIGFSSFIEIQPEFKEVTVTVSILILLDSLLLFKISDKFSKIGDSFNPYSIGFYSLITEDYMYIDNKR